MLVEFPLTPGARKETAFIGPWFEANFEDSRNFRFVENHKRRGFVLQPMWRYSIRPAAQEIPLGSIDTTRPAVLEWRACITCFSLPGDR